MADVVDRARKEARELAERAGIDMLDDHDQFIDDMAETMIRFASLSPERPDGAGAASGVDLSCDMQQAFPGGKLDDSTYQKIEDALDRIEAPMSADGRWLSLHERIAAFATPPATPVQPTASVEAVGKTLGQSVYSLMKLAFIKDPNAEFKVAGTCGVALLDYIASLTPAPTQGDRQHRLDVAFRESMDIAPATPSPAPASAPSSAGGVREASKVEIREYTPPRGERVMIWVNDRMVMKDGYCIDSVPRHVAPVIVAALSSPATPEPVSAPANGEVVEALREARDYVDDALADAERDLGGVLKYPTLRAQKQAYVDTIKAVLAKIDAALSNAPGHGEVVPVAWAREADIRTKLTENGAAVSLSKIAMPQYGIEMALYATPPAARSEPAAEMVEREACCEIALKEADRLRKSLGFPITNAADQALQYALAGRMDTAVYIAREIRDRAALTPEAPGAQEETRDA